MLHLVLQKKLSEDGVVLKGRSVGVYQTSSKHQTSSTHDSARTLDTELGFPEAHQPAQSHCGHDELS